jgi:hypothetical protein
MTPEQRQNIIEDFIQYCKDRLNIDQLPSIQYTNDREWATEKKSFGQYNPNDRSLEVYTGNRNLADTLRTLVHELVHHKQNEQGLLRMNSGKTGSNIENQANAFAGIIMREYGNKNDLIYESFLPTLKQIYEVEQSGGIQIYCDMDGVLCDFDVRFEHFYGVLPREYYTSKGSKAFGDAVNEAGIEFWSKMDWMPGGQELWSIIGKYKPYILTSPSKFEFAKEGKKMWIENNLNPQPKKVLFAQTGDKHSMMTADPKNSMLIDDYWPNLAPWKALGGIAIMHKDIDKTKDILSKFRINEISYPSSKHDVIRDEEDNSLITVEYTFKTKENNYRVEISSMEKAGDFDVSFGLYTGDFSKIDTFQMTGEGDAKNILETVSSIINKFYYEYKKYINKIIIKGTSEKRSRIYKQILPKYIDPEVLQKIEIK